MNTHYLYNHVNYQLRLAYILNKVTIDADYQYTFSKDIINYIDYKLRNTTFDDTEIYYILCDVVRRCRIAYSDNLNINILKRYYPDAPITKVNDIDGNIEKIIKSII